MNDYIERYRKDGFMPLANKKQTQRLTGINVDIDLSSYYRPENAKQLLERVLKELEGDRHPAQEGLAILLGVHTRLEGSVEEIRKAQKMLADNVKILGEEALLEVEYLTNAINK